MKLPSHILRQVKWFEHYREPTYHTYADRFVLHFKPWWKPRKTIIIEGVYARTTEDGYRLFSQHPEAAELLVQLKTQCPDQA